MVLFKSIAFRAAACYHDSYDNPLQEALRIILHKKQRDFS